MRRATVRTELDRAGAVAESVAPDNTDQMTTRVEDGAVVTTIERQTTGGLRSTVDDYVVNLDVAARTLRYADGHDIRHADGDDVPQADAHDPTTNPHDTQP